MADDNEISSGGTGGGPATTSHSEFFDGRYSIAANQLELLSRDPVPPAPPGKSVITLLATNNIGPVPTGTEGEVDIRGAKAVRITSGPFIPGLGPPAQSDSTDGVEIAVGEKQKVTILRGLVPDVDQAIEMSVNNILIDAGALGTLTLQAGFSAITIGPAGITIIGMPLVQINPGSPAPEPPPPQEDVPPAFPPGEMGA